MAPKITIEALETLDMIDKKGSFAGAAAALYRVPSAISYTIQKLEQDLDVTLFKKEGRRSVLTPAGELLLEQGREILSASEKLVESTRQVDRGWESKIRIAIDSVMDTANVFPLMKTFYELGNDVEVHLSEEVLGGSWEAIEEDRADLVIGASEPPKDSKSIQYLSIGSVHWLFCVSPNHPLSQQSQPLTEESIIAYPAVVVRDSARHQAARTRRLFSQQTKLYVPSMQQKISAQKAGLGVGYLPKHLIQSDLDAGALVALATHSQNNESPLYLGWKKSNQGRALKWFVDKLSN